MIRLRIAALTAVPLLLGAASNQAEQAKVVATEGKLTDGHSPTAETVAGPIQLAQPAAKQPPCGPRRYQSDDDTCAQWKAADAARDAAEWSKWAAIVGFVSAIGIVVALMLTLWSNLIARKQMLGAFPPHVYDADPNIWESGKGSAYGPENTLPPWEVGRLIEGSLVILNAGPGDVEVIHSHCFFFVGRLNMNKPAFKEPAGSGNRLLLWPPNEAEDQNRQSKRKTILKAGQHYRFHIGQYRISNLRSNFYIVGTISYRDARMGADKVRRGLWFTWKYNPRHGTFEKVADPEHGGRH